MSDEKTPKPKIIIDEDWKEQVQAEKEALDREKVEKPADPPEHGPIPEASLTMLVTTLATQAMVMLGVVPNPVSGKSEVDFEQAKHFIDTLGVLEEKTDRNRTPEETALLSQMLHELRMGFVEVQSHANAAPKSPLADPPN